MTPQVFLLVGSLLLFSPAYGQISGNRNSQEVGDVVFRLLDKHVPAIINSVVPINQTHSAIYVGQTDKGSNALTSPFSHKVIEMAGVPSPDGTNVLGKVIKVNGIIFTNFQEFRIAHPEYQGAFTAYNPNSTDPLQAYITQDKRKRILEAAQLLFDRGEEIAYIVRRGEHMARLLSNYFEAGVADEKNLVNYTGNYLEISRMRSDAFVEFCYSYAGVPIARSSGNLPVYLTTKVGAQYLVALSGLFSLYPNAQRDWMVPSQIDYPVLRVTEDKTERDLSGGWADTGVIDFTVDDQSSGAGFLSIHAAATGLVAGALDIPTPISLFKDGKIEAQNILPSTTVVLSPSKGLVAGYYTAVAYDHAGNSSNLVSFTIPWYALNRVDSATPLYAGFGGISNAMPSTLERTHTFSFEEPVAGVSSVSITGPQGNLISWSFDPPIKSTAAFLYDLHVGTYQVKSWNAVGAETSTPFKIGELAVSISTPSSDQQYAFHNLLEPGTFYVTARVEAQSPEGLKRIQGLELSSFTLAAESLVGGATAFADIALPFFSLSQPLAYEGGGVLSGGSGLESLKLVRAIDAAGNIQNNTFALGLGSVRVPVYGESCLDSCTQKISTDVVRSDFVGAPLLLNYALYDSMSGPYVYVPGRGPLSPTSVSEWVTQDPPLAFNMPMPITIGRLRGTLRAWAKEDKSDLVEIPSGDYEVFWDVHTADTSIPPDVSCGVHYSILTPPTSLVLCTRGGPGQPVLLGNKRFVELESVYSRTSNETVPVCGPVGDGSGNFLCRDYAVMVPPLFNDKTTFFGVTLAHQTQLCAQCGMIPSVPAGNNIYAPLGARGEVVFSNVVTAGNLPATFLTSRAPNGYAESPSNLTYEITKSTDLVFSGPARVTLKYDAASLTAAQEQRLKLAKVIDPATGKYEILDYSVDPVNNTISADVTSFSKFMVLAPEYADPQEASGGSVGGAPELEFLAGVPLTLSQYDMSSAAGQGMLASLKSADRLPVGNVYQVAGATDTYEPSAAIKMRYNASDVLLRGMSEDFLALYGISEGGDLYRLPYLTLDKDNKVLTARVPSGAYPLYAVLGSSVQAEHIPPSVYPDGISPETNIAFGGAAYPAEDGTYISTATTIMFSASDPQVPDVVTSGVDLTNYILYPDSDTVEVSTYTGPLSLSEGVRPLYYLSVDQAGNYEFPKGTTIYVDATPPVTGLTADSLFVEGGEKYVAAGSTLSLNSNDPLFNGVASGSFGTFYLVGTAVEACPVLGQLLASPPADLLFSSGTPGSCDNPLYTGSFSLEEGTHSVFYFSRDRVGNAENPRVDILYADGMPPEAQFQINGVAYADGASVAGVAGDTIAIAAQDIVSNGLASGLATTYMLINVAPEVCQSGGSGGGVNGIGSCSNPYYPGPFSLPEGNYTLYYVSRDNVGNMGRVKTAVLKPAATGLVCGGTVAKSAVLTADLDCPGVTGIALTITGDNVVLDGRGYRVNAPNAAVVLRGADISGMVIRNIALSGAPGTLKGKGLSVDHSRDVLIENVTVHNRDVGVEASGAVSLVVVRNNDLSGNRTALQTWGVTITVSGNMLSDSVTGLAASGDNLLLANDNNFRGSTTAIWLNSLTDSIIENLTLDNRLGIGGGASKRLIFRNLNLSGAGGTGFELTSTSDNVYENITAHGRDTGLKLSGQNSNSVFRNNDLSGNRLALDVRGSTMSVSGNILSGSITGLAASGDNLLLANDNDFRGSTTAIWLNSLTDSIIENLTLDNQLGIGGGSSKRLIFRNLNLSGAGGTGFNLASTSDNVYENITAHGRDTGLKLSGQNGNSVFRNNDLSGNRIALDVAGSTMSVSGNILADSVVGLFGSGSGLFLGADNDFHGSTTAVMLAELSDSVLEGLTLGNQRGLIITGGRNLTVRNMNLSGPAGARAGVGLGVYYTKDSLIENIAAHNRDYGIESRGNSGNVFRANDLTSNRVGLTLNGSVITVSNNLLGSNELGIEANFATALDLRTDNNFAGSTTAVMLAGISDSVLEGLTLGTQRGLIITGGRNLTVRNMNLSGPAGARAGVGLGVYYTKDSLIENITAHNRDSGIESRWGNSGNVFRANDLTGNRVGLTINGASITVTGNLLGGNEYGLNVDAGSGMDLRADNDFSGAVTALALYSLNDTLIENLRLNTKNAVYAAAPRRVIFRNLDLSGPGGQRTGFGLDLHLCSEVTVSGILVSNKDVGAGFSDNCPAVNLLNATLANNNVGLLLGASSGNAKISNSILWGNADNVRDLSAAAQFSYSNVQEAVAAGPGNIQADPRFVDATAGNYRLGAGSPCVDAGTNAIVGLPAGDLDGRPRIYDGDGDAVAVADMGAYETEGSSFTALSTVTINGQPEVSFTSLRDSTQALLSTSSVMGGVVIASAAESGLLLASNIYEIGPEGDYAPPAQLVFAYSEALLPGLGLSEESLAVYEFFSGTGWVRLPGQLLDPVNNTITVPITRIASLFGIFGTDKTPPAIVLNSPVAGRTYIAGRGKIVVDYSVTDNLDADPAVETVLAQIEDRGSPRGNRLSRIIVSNGQAIEPLDIDDGSWKLATSATDFSGNDAYLESETFEVLHDVLAPRSALETSGAAYRSADMVYITSAALFAVSSTDDLVAVEDGEGLGVKSQAAALKAGEQTVKALFFPNPLPKQGEVFVSSFGLTAFGSLPDGMYSFLYSAEDLLSNMEPDKKMSFALDNTPPMTAFSVVGASYEALDRVFVTGASSLLFTGVDESSGNVSSGLLLTKYKSEGGNWQVYPGSFSITSEGMHRLAYYSLDRLRNAEAEQMRNVVVDNTPPTASIMLGSPGFEIFGLPVITPDTTLILTALDPGETGLTSGLRNIYYELIDAAGNNSGILHYTEPFRITRQGTYLVRYWADDNVGNIGKTSDLKLAVTSLQRTALIASSSLETAGSADISGRVEAAIAELNGNTRILGDVYASTITLKGKAQITGVQTPLAEGFSADPLDMGYMIAKASAANNNALVPPQYLRDGRLVVPANAELTLSTGTYYFAGVELSGGSKVRMDGKGDILVSGDVLISGGSSLNLTGAASDLTLVLNTTSSLTFTGGGSLVAKVYAPQSHLRLSGNAVLGGHFFVKTAVVSGAGNIIQAGEFLPRMYTTTADTGEKKRASAFAVSGETSPALAGPNPAFRLGEVYVFPNPALRGAAPTLHIEVGIADRVKITFLTVSGRQAHEATLTGMPAALDDGTGLSYAYEYVWRDSIPSGVYYYSIEAERDGRKIKNAGKFAVVR